jgi:hypothetical protein
VEMSIRQADAGSEIDIGASGLGGSDGTTSACVGVADDAPPAYSPLSSDCS